MKKHLFLEGGIRSGKSSLIRSLVMPYLKKTGGFFVQRIYIGETYKAFSIKPVINKETYVLEKHVQSLENMDNIFLYCDKKGKWVKKEDEFIKAALTYLNDAERNNKRLILMDEIGGSELNFPYFVNRVTELLDGQISCLGVLKSSKNTAKYLKKVKDEDLILTRKFVLDRIRNHSDVDILTFDRHNFEETEKRLKSFIGEVF